MAASRCGSVAAPLHGRCRSVTCNGLYALQVRFRPGIVKIFGERELAFSGAVIEFMPVLNTPRNQRATSPTARFFHALNLPKQKFSLCMV